MWAAAPGQAAVLYDGDVVLGGGRIARPAAPSRRPRSTGVGRRRLGRVTIGPALVLAVLVGVFHTALYVLIRGTAGGRLPLIVVAAVLGAWAGDALGARLGIDLLPIGDFRLLAASVWPGSGSRSRSGVAILGPSSARA